ncbi:MAG: hypothetical protein HC767_07830 [Akkermansiaceae bacterium]|nr:hypothetical protein [Akkermansiaceae bacterium]
MVGRDFIRGRQAVEAIIAQPKIEIGTRLPSNSDLIGAVDLIISLEKFSDGSSGKAGSGQSRRYLFFATRRCAKMPACPWLVFYSRKYPGGFTLQLRTASLLLACHLSVLLKI